MKLGTSRLTAEVCAGGNRGRRRARGEAAQKQARSDDEDAGERHFRDDECSADSFVFAVVAGVPGWNLSGTPADLPLAMRMPGKTEQQTGDDGDEDGEDEIPSIRRLLRWKPVRT